MIERFRILAANVLEEVEFLRDHLNMSSMQFSEVRNWQYEMDKLVLQPGQLVIGFRGQFSNSHTIT